VTRRRHLFPSSPFVLFPLQQFRVARVQYALLTWLSVNTHRDIFFSRNGSFRAFSRALARIFHYLRGIFIFSARARALSLSHPLFPPRLFWWIPFCLLKRPQIRSLVKIIFTMRYSLRALRALRTFAVRLSGRLYSADFNDFRQWSLIEMFPRDLYSVSIIYSWNWRNIL